MPAAIAIPMLVSAGVSAYAAHKQASAAKNVAAQQAKAAQSAAGLQQTAADQTLAQQGSLLDRANASYQPYTDVGTQAAGQLSALQPFQATTGADLASDPGYQFRQAEDQRNAQRSAAAHGTLLTGGTLKALQDRSQALASNEFANVDARRNRDYQQNFGNLSSLLNFGAGQNADLQHLNLGYAGAMGSARAMGAGAAAGGITDTANALGAGQIGASNAITNGVSNISGNLQQMLMLQQLLAKQPGSGGIFVPNNREGGG